VPAGIAAMKSCGDRLCAQGREPSDLTHVPAAVRDRLNAELVKVMALPEVRQQLGSAGIDAMSSTPAQLARFLETELERWSTHIRNAGITPE
jgi:tripartite-type tricarboxylate transporter receptor subunit TctC